MCKVHKGLGCLTNLPLVCLVVSLWGGSIAEPVD